MEVKLNALMLRGVDYKDNDKMLTLYSLERGLVSASIRGVKKAGAKLKFASQPFCFAEYILNYNGERAVVTGATELESFYNLRLDIPALYSASVVAEYLIKCAGEERNEELFMLAINTVKQLNFSSGMKIYALADFLIKAMQIEGYKIEGAHCKNCFALAHLGEFAYFDFESGSLFCEDCKIEGSTRILSVTAEALESVILGEECEGEKVKYLLKFLAYYINLKMGVALNSIDELLQMV
ncbi:MAG: DNA repair protein RecO [Clostridia bacterium]|nr:DNA repair protein RecO [Clostridia bacterium]